MTTIFSLPVIQRSSGDRLYFYQTGSSTPQNVYSDVDLQNALTQPVEADADGYFPLIYTDPALPDYRVKLTTSAGALIWQKDDVPSAPDTSTSYRIKHTTPELIIEETDAGTNAKKWRLRASGGVLTLCTLDDAESSTDEILRVTRSGVTITAVDLDGVAPDDDTFTVTLTGVSGTVTGTASYAKVGKLVTLRLPPLSGTSTTTAKTFTGLPVALRPTVNTIWVCTGVNNSGSAAVAILASILANSSTVTFTLLTSDGLWTGSGVCSVTPSTVTYEVAS